MKKVKHLFGRFFVCVVTCMVMLCGTAFAAEEDIAYVKDVLAANRDLTSGQTWANIVFVSPIVKGTVEVNGKEIFQPNVFCKGEANFTGSGIWGDSIKCKIPFYMEEVDDNPVSYWQYNEQWYKVADTFKTKKLDSLIEATMMAKIASDSAFIKSAETVFNNDIQRRVQVIIDGKAIGELLKELTEIIDQETKAVPVDAKAKANQIGAKKAMEFFYASLGNLPVEYTIDVATKRITALKADVSPTLRNVAVSAVNQYMPGATADQKEMLDRLLNSCTLKIDAVYTMHDNVKLENVAVPANVKAAAQDLLEVAKKEALPAVK